MIWIAISILIGVVAAIAAVAVAEALLRRALHRALMKSSGLSRRIFLVTGAASAGTALFPRHVRPGSRVAQLDTYILTDTLVLQDFDVVQDVLLIWRGPADKPIVRFAGNRATFTRNQVLAESSARAYVLFEAGISEGLVSDSGFDTASGDCRIEAAFVIEGSWKAGPYRDLHRYRNRLRLDTDAGEVHE